MTTVTDPADLVTPEEAAGFLNMQPGDFTDTAVLITRASKLCELYTHRLLAARAVTNQRLSVRRGPKLYINPFPVDPTQAVTIKVDGVTQTVWRQESDGNPDTYDVILGHDDPTDPRTGTANHFWRFLTWDTWALGRQWEPASDFQWRTHPFAILASWTGGFSPIPQDLKLACLYVLQQIYRDWTKAETSVSSQSARAGGGRTFTVADVPAKASVILDDFKSPAMPFAGA
jgi:hypothetical protein